MLTADRYTWLAHRVSIMGILNITPDSFSDGGRYPTVDKALERALRLVAEGAEIIDIGGESTRPGSDSVSVQDELDRTMPVVERLAKESDCLISIDTCKSEVASEALASGAHIVNDISGGTSDRKMFATVQNFDAGMIIMHMQGTPKTMQSNPSYKDVVAEVQSFLGKQCKTALKHGVSKLFIDPGFGFGKTQDHNYRLLKRLEVLCRSPFPVVVGTSRKSFLGQPFKADPADRLEGTIVSNIVAAEKGARILRVHDVLAVKRALVISAMIAEAS